MNQLCRKRQENWWIFGLVMVACCMRSPMSGVGPLVSQISEGLSLSASTAGMLTTIPLLIFALISPLVSKLALVAPIRMQISCCVACLAVGILTRSYLGLWGLFVGTALVGVGIGTLNVVLPLFVKSNFAGRIGGVMACYTAMMTLFSAVASGSVAFLSVWLGGWSHALALFAILPLLAFPIWVAVSRGMPDAPGGEEETGASLPLFSAVNGCAALFFGLQSFLFFGIIAWLPSILAVSIPTEGEVALMMFVMQLASLITNFAMPLAMQRRDSRGRSRLGLGCATVYLAGFVLVLLGLSSPLLSWLGILVLGLGGGMSISYILTFISIRPGSRRDTARLSAFTQCGGYLIAAPGPFLIGALTDWTGSFILPLYIFIAVCVAFLFVGRQLALLKTGA